MQSSKCLFKSSTGPVASERLETVSLPLISSSVLQLKACAQLKKVDRYHMFCLRVANELLTMTQISRAQVQVCRVDCFVILADNMAF